MDILEKLSLFGPDMNLEMDGSGLDCSLSIKANQIPITEAQMPNGKRIKLLKTMQTSVCERNCYYCPFRSGRDMRRVTFQPNELASVFIQLYKANMVEGLFLSSGIIGGGLRTQDKIIETAEILRTKFKFHGYIHLKIMPGAEHAQVEQAMHLASRISVNLEAPNNERLQLLAPHKVFTEELLKPLQWAEEIRKNRSPHRSWNGRWPSSTTQFVIGAVGESDLELLATSEYLYNQTRIKRAYYSRFNPVQDTPLENHPPENPVRQHRLYQSSFLIRDYGFSLEDMPFDECGNLPKNTDPKLAWAKKHLTDHPIELNRATYKQLLQIPGIGPKGAAQIIKTRRERALKDLSELSKLGIITKRAATFILLNGKRPNQQLLLF